MKDRRYDVLLCDADNTLFDFTRAEENAFAVACSAAGFVSTPALLSLYSRINDALFKRLERGEITQSALRVCRFEQFLKSAGIDADPTDMANVYVQSLSEQAMPLPGAVEAVECFSAILPIVVITNGISWVQRSRMQRSPFARHIAGMIVSEEIGAAKPDPRMLYAGMAQAGVQDKSRALVLGDSLTSDMQAAANAGIDGCWFNPQSAQRCASLPIRYEVRSLDEVDGILMGGT